MEDAIKILEELLETSETLSMNDALSIEEAIARLKGLL